MNRPFLIFLMVATALMIAVIGNRSRPTLPGYLPWEVKVLDNGSTRIFGITLGKTRIQDANQILASFPDNQLITQPADEAGLYAVYDQLNLGGFLARLELQYDLDDEQLARLLPANDDSAGGYRGMSEREKMELLNATVKRIRYIPQVNYTADLLLQHFGQPNQQQTVGPQQQRWRYRVLGLDILVNADGPEVFTYHHIQSATDETTPVHETAPPTDRTSGQRQP